MNKFKQNNKVAIIYHPDYGLGWYTHYKQLEMLYCPELAHMLMLKEELYESDEDNPAMELAINECIMKILKNKFDIDTKSGYELAERLTIDWVVEGTTIKIDNYDGKESITYLTSDTTIIVV